MTRIGLLLATVLLISATAFAGTPITPTNYGEMEPVLFDHSDHSERLACSQCHHDDRSEHRCGYCHKAEAAGKVPSMEDAAHGDGIGKCWSCHLQDEARKPLECEDCHRG